MPFIIQRKAAKASVQTLEFPSPSLTIAILLHLALFLLVALITGAGSVKAPVQDVTKQPFLLLGQLSRGRGHEAGSVGLHGIIPPPRGESTQTR